MSTLPRKVSAVLFDLDGTLVDTAPDMVRALNRLCAESGVEPLAYDAARKQVSQGAIGLVRLAFPELDEHTAQSYAERFRDHYAERVFDGSALFDGMAEVLNAVENAGLTWGIVTNKPERFTTPLIDALGLTPRSACVVSGDTTARSKPHPLPLIYACGQIQHAPQDCVYVGDDQRDIIAGKAAGMHTVAALYGYILDHEQPNDWQPDDMIEQPRDLLAVLEIST